MSVTDDSDAAPTKTALMSSDVDERLAFTISLTSVWFPPLSQSGGVDGHVTNIVSPSLFSRRRHVGPFDTLIVPFTVPLISTILEPTKVSRASSPTACEIPYCFRSLRYSLRVWPCAMAHRHTREVAIVISRFIRFRRHWRRDRDSNPRRGI